MVTIRGLSNEEIETIHNYIVNGKSGHLDKGQYHKTIFERYFKNRVWVWPEYEKWKRVFIKLGDWPVTWGRLKPWCLTEEIDVKDILATLKVSEIKELLKYLKVRFEPKANKVTLIDLVLTQPLLTESLPKFPVWTRALNDYSVRGRSELYSILMRTIDFRATSLNDQKRQSNLVLKHVN